MILVISHPADDHAAGVLAELAARGYPAALVDTGLFPAQGSLSQHFGDGQASYGLRLTGSDIDLAACHVAWWRRPRPFGLHEGVAPEVAAFTYTECHEAMAGLWAALDVEWINPPALDEAAHHKPYQLAIAGEVGLQIPRTLITNDPDELRQFVTRISPQPIIYKTFLATEQHWRETRLLREDDLPLLDNLRLAPAIFQEFVPATCDVRVTVIGKQVFATAITTLPGGYEFDYRMDLGGASLTPTELQPATLSGIAALMSRLGLVYGAIDLRRQPDGREVFLEINPAGEWRFVEDRTAQPITEAMADLLMERDEGSDRGAAN